MKKLTLFIASLIFSASNFAQVVNPTFVGPGGKPTTFTNHGVLIGHGTSNVSATAAGTAGECLLSGGASADPAFGPCSGGGGSGTVTSVSVVTANGFSGSVANPTTTPAITMSTGITGVLKGSAGALAAAVAGDFPTLNQNTTGTASNVTGTVAVANGGTGLTATPTNGQIDIGNGTGFTRTTISAGSGVTVTNGAGSITIAATSVATTVNLIATITTTATTTAESLNFVDSNYDGYKIVFNGLTPSADDTLQLRVAVAGVVDTANVYVSAANGTGSTNTSWPMQSSNTIESTGVGASGYVELTNLNSATKMKGGYANTIYFNAAASYAGLGAQLGYPSANAVSGIRFYWGSGANFVAGSKIYIYGFKNT